MADLNPTDLLLVNRNDTTQKVTQGNLMAELLDTDYMVLQRNDATYKITGLDLKNSVVDPLVVTVQLSDSTPLVSIPITAFVNIAGGKDPFSTTYQWKLRSSGGVETDIAGATSSTYTPELSEVGSNLACYASVTDDLGDTASGQSNWSNPIDSPYQPPIIGSALLSENDPSGARFTAEDFTVNLGMTQDGIPVSEKLLKPYVIGGISAFGVTSDIVSVTDNTVNGVWAWSGNWDQNPKFPAAYPPNKTAGDFGFNAAADGNYNYGPSSAGGYANTITGDHVFAQGGDVVDLFNYYPDDGSGNYLILDDDSRLDAVSKTYASGSNLYAYSTFVIPAGRTCQTIKVATTNTARADIFGVMVNDVAFLDNWTYTTKVLNLQNDKDLEYFQPGDSVYPTGADIGAGSSVINGGTSGSQTNNITVYKDDGTTASALTGNIAQALCETQAWFNNDVNDSAKTTYGNNGMYNYTTTFTYSGLGAGQTIELNIGSATGGAGVQQADVSGDVVQTVISTNGSAKNTLPTTNVQLTTTQESGTFTISNANAIFIFWWQVTPNYDIVLDVNKASSNLTVNGGPYQIGDTVSNSIERQELVTLQTSDITHYAPVVTGGSITSWSTATAAQMNSWRDVTYGNGTFVAVANTSGAAGSQRVMYSGDGISWTGVTPPGDVSVDDWYSVAFGGNTFVAVAGSGTNRVMYSTNGVAWTLATPAVTNNWGSVCYGNGKFVAVGTTSSADQVMYSSDGISWLPASVPETNPWQGVTYGNGKYVAVAYSGTNRVMYSSDAVSWSVASAPEGAWYDVTYGNGEFVAVGYSGTYRCMHSSDGITWTAATIPENNAFFAVTYGAGNFVAIANSGSNQIMYSPNGSSWSVAAAPASDGWYGVVYGGDKFLAVGKDGSSRVMYSDFTATNPVLTFVDDTSLANIPAGTPVEQTTPVTPVTSAIINANNATEISNFYMSTTLFNNRFAFEQALSTGLADGSILAITDQKLGGAGYLGYLYILNDPGVYQTNDYVWSSNATMTFPSSSGWTATCVWRDGTYGESSGNYGQSEFNTWRYTTSLSGSGPSDGGNFNGTTIPEADVSDFIIIGTDRLKVSANELGNYPLQITASPLTGKMTTGDTVLTFQDNTQLANFLPGDVVGGANSGRLVINSSSGELECSLADSDGSILRAPVNSTYDVKEFTHDWTFFTTGGAQFGASYTGSQAPTYEIVSTNGLTTTAPVTGTVSSTQTAPTLFPVSITQPGATISVKFTYGSTIQSDGSTIMYYVNSPSSATSNINGQSMCFGGGRNPTTVDTNIGGLQSGPVVISTDEGANQMTLTSGIFSNGQTVTGSVINGTGTCEGTDPAGPTMTVSGDNARFAVGAQVKTSVGVPNPEAKMYCVTAPSGQILDLIGSDPGYTVMTSTSTTQTLSFPLTFPTGESPDNELLPGTSLTVDCKAQNSEGSSTMTTNVVTPT